jgi:hypothetical protein
MRPSVAYCHHVIEAALVNQARLRWMTRRARTRWWRRYDGTCGRDIGHRLATKVQPNERSRTTSVDLRPIRQRRIGRQIDLHAVVTAVAAHCRASAIFVEAPDAIGEPTAIGSWLCIQRYVFRRVDFLPLTPRVFDVSFGVISPGAF